MQTKRATRLLWILSAAMFLFALLRPIDDLDIFTQLTLGKLLYGERGFAAEEPFSFIAEGSVYSANGWLAQITGFLLLKLGSWPLLRIAAAFVFAGSFFISGLAAAKTAGRYTNLSLCFAVVMGYLTALSNSSVRPQIASLFGMALLYLFCRSKPGSLFHVLIFIPAALIWQNFHPSLSMGTLLAAIFIADNLIQARQKKERIRSDLPLLLLVTLAAQPATPLGAQIFSLSALNLQISRDLLGVSEWMPPWHPAVFNAMMPFWINLFITAALLLKSGRRETPANLLIIAVFTALSLYSARFTFYWGILMIPFWAAHLADFLPSSILSADPEQPVKNRPRGIALFLLFNIAAAFLLTRGRQLDPGIPDQAVRLLKERVPSGNIYNYREWGGIITFFGYPDLKVMLDGRLYLYSPAQWESYRQEALGRVAIEEIEARYTPAAFFLHKSFHRALIDRLIKLPRWEVAYAHGDCVVFLPGDSLTAHTNKIAAAGARNIQR